MVLRRLTEVIQLIFIAQVFVQVFALMFLCIHNDDITPIHDNNLDHSRINYIATHDLPDPPPINDQ